MNTAGGHELGYASRAILSELMAGLISSNAISPDAANGILSRAVVSLQGLGNNVSALGAIKVVEDAVTWYKMAIDGGDAWAMVQLGRIYFEGEGGVPVDQVATLALWRRAADQGDEEAMYELGMLYLSGSEQVSKDLRVARDWLEKASNSGHANAKFELAIMYRDGEGGPRDFKREATLLQEASKLGHADAMNDLGVIYQRGNRGLPRNIDMALQMYRLAAAAGSELGAQNLRYLVADLNRPQVTYSNAGGGGRSMYGNDGVIARRTGQSTSCYFNAPGCPRR